MSVTGHWRVLSYIYICVCFSPVHPVLSRGTCQNSQRSLCQVYWEERIRKIVWETGLDLKRGKDSGNCVGMDFLFALYTLLL